MEQSAEVLRQAEDAREAGAAQRGMLAQCKATRFKEEEGAVLARFPREYEEYPDKGKEGAGEEVREE